MGWHKPTHNSTSVTEYQLPGLSALDLRVVLGKGKGVPMSGNTNSPHGSAPLPVGTPAPDFTLNSTPDQRLSLFELRGQPVILAFYPADWSPVCGDQMALYQEILPEFEQYGAQLIGVSVDGPWCHVAFAQARRLRSPLLADFEPRGDVARRYGVYRD